MSLVKVLFLNVEQATFCLSWPLVQKNNIYQLQFSLNIKK